MKDHVGVWFSQPHTPTPILERGEEKLFNRKGKGKKKVAASWAW